MEKEQEIEPVSAVERERTMRNLVDMQRKVEQRQQRDRERQLLRVRNGKHMEEKRVIQSFQSFKSNKCLSSGSGASFHHPAQKGRGRLAGP